MQQPPLQTVVAAVARWVGGGTPLGVFWVVVAVLCAALALWIVATADCAERRAAWQGMAVAASPVVAAVGLVDLDLLPIALSAAGLALLRRGQSASGGLLLGLAMGGGTLSAVIAIAAIAAEGMRRGTRHALTVGGAALLIAVALHWPYLIANADGVLTYYYEQIKATPGPGSPWFLGQLGGLDLRHGGSYGFAGLVIALGCFLGFLRASGRRPTTEPVVAAAVLAALGLAPSFPPQSGLWVLFAVALFRPRRTELAVVALTQLAHTAALWWVTDGATRGVAGPYWLYWPALVAQLAAMFWLLVLAAREAVRSEPTAPSVASGTRTGATAVGDRVRWWPAVVTSVVAVTLTRAAFLLIGYCGQWIMNDEHTKPTLNLEVWIRWDTRLFIEVMEKGYGPAYDNGPAFFPAFPLAMRALHAMGLEPIVAGMLISYAASIVACTYLYQLARSHHLGGEQAVLYLLLFPTGVFLAAAYTEALFLAGAIPAFYYARRGKPWLAGAFCALAVASRTVGLLLLVGVVYELVVRAWPSWRKLAATAGAALVAVAPFIAFGLHLRQERGSFFDFARAQKEGWGREFHGFREAFDITMRTWEQDYTASQIFTYRLEVVFAFLMLALLFWLMWQCWVGYALYVGLTLIVALGNVWYYSNPRLALSLFPIVFPVAALVGRSRSRHAYATATLALVAGAGGLVFTRGAWFF